MNYIFLLITICSLLIEISKANTIRQSLNQISLASTCIESNHRKKNIAHRGNSYDYMENSLPAFASAAELRSDLVELDVVLTKNNIPLISHDTDLVRSDLVLCGQLQNQLISNHTLHEIQTKCRFTRLQNRPEAQPIENLKYLKNFEANLNTIPSLEDLLVMLSPSKTGLLIELKTYIQYGQQNINIESNRAVLDLLSYLDSNQECINTLDTGRNSKNYNYDCFEKIQIMSFHQPTIDFIRSEILNNPKYKHLHRIKLLRLIGYSELSMERLVDSNYSSQIWDLDGVAFDYRFGNISTSVNEYRLNEIIRKLNCENNLSKNKIKYLWTAYAREHLEVLKTKNIHGIINGIPNFLYLQPSLRVIEP